MDVFVYGTLTDPERVAEVVPSFEFRGDAVLSGLHRVAADYPTLAPGGETAGRILTTDDIDALDAYEGVDRGLYVRVSVPTTEGGSVAVYVGDPRALGARDVSWPGSGPLTERISGYMAANGVSVDVSRLYPVE